MIIDGKQIAQEILQDLAQRAKGDMRRLGIVVVGDDPVIESFVRIKMRAAAQVGVPLERIDLDAAAPQADVVAAIQSLASRVQGIIVQLPLPAHINVDAVLSEIPASLDVDGIRPHDSKFVAPVALAVQEILTRAGVVVEGKKCVVVGAGRLVGAPVARLLTNSGGIVRTITRDDGSLEELVDADIIVSGAGEPGIITPDLIKNRVVLIDAGTSESGGRVRGDAEPDCAHKCAVFTPVPGGVGPIAVAMIFRNLLHM